MITPIITIMSVLLFSLFGIIYRKNSIYPLVMGRSQVDPSLTCLERIGGLNESSQFAGGIIIS